MDDLLVFDPGIAIEIYTKAIVSQVNLYPQRHEPQSNSPVSTAEKKLAKAVYEFLQREYTQRVPELHKSEEVKAKVGMPTLMAANEGKDPAVDNVTYRLFVDIFFPYFEALCYYAQGKIDKQTSFASLYSEYNERCKIYERSNVRVPEAEYFSRLWQALADKDNSYFGKLAICPLDDRENVVLQEFFASNSPYTLNKDSVITFLSSYLLAHDPSYQEKLLPLLQAFSQALPFSFTFTFVWDLKQFYEQIKGQKFKTLILVPRICKYNNDFDISAEQWLELLEDNGQILLFLSRTNYIAKNDKYQYFAQFISGKNIKSCIYAGNNGFTSDYPYTLWEIKKEPQSYISFSSLYDPKLKKKLSYAACQNLALSAANIFNFNDLIFGASMHYSLEQIFASFPELEGLGIDYSQLFTFDPEGQVTGLAASLEEFEALYQPNTNEQITINLLSQGFESFKIAYVGMQGNNSYRPLYEHVFAQLNPENYKQYQDFIKQVYLNLEQFFAQNQATQARVNNLAQAKSELDQAFTTLEFFKQALKGE
ncbi:hypothetical protein CJP74_00355 [Psittacicella melopsittaci]|uniref:Uncharacterized protein n=1 Tax=Psittacicella melopsittaci TaxID=2028576 RepID=A0A3A1Y9R5_9GAMM|nr:hypothetical protein [Psittacicella melopsittaci]RIY34066.1 hypothetical protein CJP74_00355 [Psittacicella melopsittaci]